MALRGEKYTGLAVGYANICVRRVKKSKKYSEVLCSRRKKNKRGNNNQASVHTR